MIDVPADDPELKRFVEEWKAKGRGNPRAAMGV
jgi:hypothetical protein